MQRWGCTYLHFLFSAGAAWREGLPGWLGGLVPCEAACSFIQSVHSTCKSNSKGAAWWAQGCIERGERKGGLAFQQSPWGPASPFPTLKHPPVHPHPPDASHILAKSPPSMATL